jgi:hypothetical protein
VKITVEFNQEMLINYLRDLHDNAFPATVRDVLNDIVKEMKGTAQRQGGIQKAGRQLFDYERNKTFIRSLTWADYAKGLDIDNMESGAGIKTNKPNKDKVAPRMENQEIGDDLQHTYAPTKDARKGKSLNQKVYGKYQHKNITYKDLTNISGGYRYRLMIKSHKERQPVRIKTDDGDIAIIYPIGRLKKKGDNKAQFRFLYFENKNKTARLKKARPFVQLAAKRAVANTEMYFNRAFDKRINKKR